MKTLVNVIRDAFPEVVEDLNKNGCWDYNIYAPCSFDDPAHIHIIVGVGNSKTRKIREYDLYLYIGGGKECRKKNITTTKKVA